VVKPDPWAEFVGRPITVPDKAYNFLIPVHLRGNHWALGVVDVHAHRWEYLDSGWCFDTEEMAAICSVARWPPFSACWDTSGGFSLRDSSALVSRPTSRTVVSG
jgi:hypothetical protein